MESIGLVRQNVFGLLWAPPLRRILRRVPVLRRVYGGWSRRHPIDVDYGIDTSGYISADVCAPDAALASHISPYGGSQPSIVRASLAVLPDREEYAFVDLGCGKGRPLVLASEFGFQRILGVEISPALAAVARANAAAIGAGYPARTPIEVLLGDATAAPVAGRRVVYYMYHPFDRSLVQLLVTGIARQLMAGVEHGFFVYYNPVHGDVLDRSARFRRWSAEEFGYEPGELGYGPDASDTVVIWQTQPPRYAARAGADRQIVFPASGSHAELAR
jgi:SAM-dependent methyltransferase